MESKGRRLRVLELSHAVAGPTATQILADYGADVIKIERPQGGDIFRDTPGMGPAFFLAVNRGKRSIVLDIGSKKGLKLFYDLVKRSDVLVENLSPGTAEKLGVTASKVRRANRRIVFCRIQSFGKGPMEKVPAFDPVLQAAVGIMSTTGFAPNKYARAGVSIVDMSAGMHAAIGILFMLLSRERTGVGGLIEIPLYDSASYYMSYWMTRFGLTGEDTMPLGSTHIFGAPYNLFKTSDGYVYIAVAGERDWISFTKSLGFEDLASRSEYSSPFLRVENKQRLEEELSNRLRNLKTESVERAMLVARVPFSRLNSAKTLKSDPQFQARKLLREYSFEGKRFETVVNPCILNGKRRYAKENPPSLGEHTSEILREVLGLRNEEIQSLAESKIVKSIK